MADDNNQIYDVVNPETVTPEAVEASNAEQVKDDRIVNDLNQQTNQEIQQSKVYKPEKKADEQVIQEALDELKYGDEAVKAAALGSLQSLSLGTALPAAKNLGLIDDEQIKNIEKTIQYNKGAFNVGDLGTTFITALLSGGSSAAAKIASKTGVGLATKAGIAAERQIAKGLAKKFAADPTTKGLVRDIIAKAVPKSAGSAVESAFYANQQLLNESFLGDADYTAEAAIANAAQGAVLGGAVGGLFGTAEVLVPKVAKKGVDTIKSKYTDINRASDDIIGLTTKQKADFQKSGYGVKLYQNIPKQLGAVLKDEGPLIKRVLKRRSGIEQIARAATKRRERVGSQIEKTIKELSDDVKNSLDGGKIYSKLDKKLADIQFKISVNAKGDIIDENAFNYFQKIRSDNRERLLNQKYSLDDLWKDKQLYQNRTKYNKSLTELPYKNQVDRVQAEVFRESLIEHASDLGNKDLEQLFLDYGTLKVLDDNLMKQAAKDPKTNFMPFRDGIMYMVTSPIIGSTAATGLILGKGAVESNIYKQMKILANYEKSIQKVNKTINSSTKNFMKGTKRKAAKSTTLNALMKFGLSREKKESGVYSKPKTKQQALSNLKSNLERFTSSPQELVNEINGTDLGHYRDVAPLTVSNIEGTLYAAIAFLQNEMPKPANMREGDMFTKREYKMSDVEASKFDRYVQVISNPMSVLEELEARTLTQDHVKALRSVYPKIYNKIRDQIIVEAQESEKPIPYIDRLQLKTLLDIDTDASLSNDSIQYLQNNFKEAQESQAGGAIASNKPVPMTRASKLDMAESNLTDVQRVSNRKDLA